MSERLDVIGLLRVVGDCLERDDLTAAVEHMREAEAQLYSGAVDDDTRVSVRYALASMMRDAQARRDALAEQLQQNGQTRSAVRHYGHGFAAGHRAYGGR